MGFSLEFVVYHVLLGTLPMDSYEKCRFRECSQYRSASRSISIDALYEAREDVLAWLCRVEGQLHVAAFHSTRDGTPGPLMSEAFDVRVSRNVNGDVEWTFPIDGSESLAACKVSRTHRVLWTPTQTWCAHLGGGSLHGRTLFEFGGYCVVEIWWSSQVSTSFGSTHVLFVLPLAASLLSKNKLQCSTKEFLVHYFQTAWALRQIFFQESKWWVEPKPGTSCWWKKSCTRHVWNPAKYWGMNPPQ